MKNKVNTWALTFGLGVLLSFNAFGQRDTINYWKGQLYLAIKDTICFPTGYSLDSFVLTNNPDLDNIFKSNKVKELLKWDSGYTDHNVLDSVFKLFCVCDEYKLMDTLSKYNVQNNLKSFYGVGRVPRYTNDIKIIYHLLGFNFFPNPITDYLFIENNNPGNYNLQLFKINGQEVYSVKNITSNNFKLDATCWENGVYYILITSKVESIVKKIIKN